MQKKIKNVSRRRFLKKSVFCLAAVSGIGDMVPFLDHGGRAVAAESAMGSIFKGDAPRKRWKWSKEAFLYKKIEGKKTVCGICPHRCRLSPGDRSICRSRINHNGKMYSLTYGNPCAVNLDPIEKKPLFHFLPGSTAFSIAAAGCNLRCLNCQNWEISQAKPHEVRQYDMPSGDIVWESVQAGAQSIAYTYSEPVTFLEYVLDTADAAKAENIHNVFISAGYINRKPLEAVCQRIDGANINLKSFSDEIYLRLNGARLKPVLNTFETLHEKGVYFEITHLVVPGYVDDAELFARMCDWILAKLGPNYPLHLLRFFPRYKLNRLSPTPVSTLEKFREAALSAGIRYVYIGNVPGHPGNNTHCHNCGKLLIERKGYRIPINNMNGNQCRFCDTVIPGVWE